MASQRTMRAAVLHGREDVRIETVERPWPGPGEVLVRNEVALTCGTDAKVFRRGYHARMIVPPAIFGHEVAGVVEEVGEGLRGFAAGQPVVWANSAPCDACEHCREGRPGLCDDLLFWNGAYAQYSVLPARLVARNLLHVPEGLALRRAAMSEPLACVVRGLEPCRVRPGQSVAVIGTGAIGLMFVVLLKARGAHVISAGRGAHGLRRAQQFGADVALSTGAGDLADQIREHSRDGRGVDVAIEAVGLPETAEAAVASARKGGIVNVFGGSPADSVLRLDAARLHYQELTLLGTFHHTPSSFREALALIARGVVDPEQFVRAEAPLDALPEVLRALSHGGGAPKTAILPWAPASSP